MRCIFCKQTSGGSVSVEHIIPESLGNTEHWLPQGWVCDICNNYLAREVEKPFLDSEYGRSARFELGVWNKRGRIPALTGLHPETMTKVELFRSRHDGSLSVGAHSSEDQANWIKALSAQSHGTLMVPVCHGPEASRTTSRFIGKVALELLARRFMGLEDGNDQMLAMTELDELLRYVRIGNTQSVWPVRMRRIYQSQAIFTDSTGVSFNVLNDSDFLHLPNFELYAVIAIFGIEFVINLAGPVIDGYDQWLKENDFNSLLYPPTGCGGSSPAA